MTRAAFFTAIRPHFPGRLSDEQVRRISVLLDATKTTQLERRAYIFATAHHETDAFRAMEEYGKGKGRPYGKPIELFPGYSRTYYGRGYCQLTWCYLYAKLAMIVGVDLVNEPEKAADERLAARIIVEGMEAGTFTGRKLFHYINHEGVDYVNARRIINDTDKAEHIAGIARMYERALRAAEETVVAEAYLDNPLEGA